MSLWLKHQSMGDEKDAFYVVRKGNVIGIYKSLSDLQALIRSSVGEPSISVFKGYHLAKESEEYLTSHGLKNAMYSVDSTDVRDDLFGLLVPCPFRQPGSSKDKPLSKDFQEKRAQEMAGSPLYSTAAQQKPGKLDNFLEVPPISSYCSSCILEFDGASKGNPGLAGAGAVLRAADGSMVFRLREGTQGIWRTKNQNMAELSKVVREYKDQFTSFQINHVEREYNSEADAQANLAVYLKNGEFQVDCGMK
nr:uncharacterized protein LOC109178191 [Ipomoea batatas]